MEHDGWTYIYLTASRDRWNHVTDGWESVAFQRFEFVDCGIYRRRTDDLIRDAVSEIEWAAEHGEPGKEFVTPAGWVDPRKQLPPEAPSIEGEHKLVSAKFVVAPAFPFTLAIGTVKIEMHVDGTWTGDKAAFVGAMAMLKGQFGLNTALMWLVARALTPETERKP